MAAEILGRQRLLEPGEIERLVMARARRIASATVKAWLASIMISKPGPTASRTAASRATSSLTCGPADLDLGAAEALRLRRQRVVDDARCGSICSQPPSVV